MNTMHVLPQTPITTRIQALVASLALTLLVLSGIHALAASEATALVASTTAAVARA
jgi:hypothetical protein